MPKIKITDFDNTGVIQSPAISNAVYIPGPVVAGQTGRVAAKKFDTLAALESYNNPTGSNPVVYNENCLSYKLMLRLLQYGISVVYEGIKEETPNTYPADATKGIDFEKLADKTLQETGPIRFLTMGGYNFVKQELVQIAAKRGDCIALLDHPVTFEGDDEYQVLTAQPADWATNYTNYYTKSGSTYTKVPQGTGAPTWVANTFYTKLTKKVDLVRKYFETHATTTVANGLSYSAAFTPAFNTTDELFKYTNGGTTAFYTIPASFGFLFAYARAIQNNPEWYSAAGSFRGIITELSNVTYKYGYAECEQLQGRSKTDGTIDLDGSGDNVGSAINPITYVDPFGTIIWGDRTFIVNDGATKASSFLNVRNLVCILKKALYAAARKYTFEQNDDILYSNFKAQITPYLDKMQSGNGILGYKFVKLATNKKARLKARLIIIPIEPVEDFELEIELADAIEVVE